MGHKIAFDAIGELPLSGKTKIKYFFGLMLCVFGIGFTASAIAPTDLDIGFGDRGLVYSDAAGRFNYGYGMSLQADGKIVMVGNRAEEVNNFNIVRYNANGSPDATFGSGGAVAGNFGGSSQSARSVAVQADGKIVVGGHAYFQSRNDWDLALVRFNPNGSVDTSFGTNGIVIIGYFGTELSENYKDQMGAIKIAADGKIVVGGSAISSGMFHRASLARLNTDGSLDTGFGTGGKVLVEGYVWNDLVIKADGEIAAVGTNLQSFAVQILLARFNSSGGVITRSVGGVQGDQGFLYGIAELSNGNYVAVGRFNGKVSVICLGTSCAQTFTPNSIDLNGKAVSVAVQRDGKIVISVIIGSDTSSSAYSLIRLNPNGLPDTGFGTNGVFTTPVNSNTQVTPAKIIIQPDGKYLIGGYAIASPPAVLLFSMARYRGDSFAPVKIKFDYDGDDRSDVSVFRPSENRWYILRSSSSTVIQPQFGTTGDIPVPSDFDGDGKTDIAIFRPSSAQWWYLSSFSGTARAAQWGQNGDIPLPSDYDGDGKADYVLYRPSEGKWHRLGNSGGTSIVSFGTAGDKPLIGDFDGDGKADPAIYRPSTGVWWYAASSESGAHRAIQFGVSTDIPVPADYDGDGKTDFAVFRPSDGGWHIFNSSNQSYVAFPFGSSEDKPVSADYDGDGKVDVGVFRPSNGSWYLLRSTSGFSGVQWGASTDIPTQNSFIQ